MLQCFSHVLRPFQNYFSSTGKSVGEMNTGATRGKYLLYLVCTGTQLLIVIIDATWNVNACYYEVPYASARSLRMRRSQATFHILCPWTVSITCFALVKINKSRVCKIGVHYDLQNSSMFPLEVNWNTYGTCVFQLMAYKVDM